MPRRNLSSIACFVSWLFILGATPFSPEISTDHSLLPALKLPELQLPSWLTRSRRVLTPSPVALRHGAHPKCGNAADPNGTPCP